MSKVLLATPSFPPRLGGLERYTHRLATGLQERAGHEVVVVTTGPGRETRVRDHDGLRVIALPTRVVVSATPFNHDWFRQVRQLIRVEQPDVINTHAPAPGLADVCLAARGQTPTIATYHSGSMRKHQGVAVDAAIGCYETLVLPRLLKRADTLVTTHPGRGTGGLTSRYVPPGVDTSLFSPRREGAAPDNVVLYVGRVERASSWKGIGTLLRAFAQLVGARPDLRLRIVGAGDAVDDHRKAAADLGIESKVDFVGALAGAELAEAYRQATITVVPSETDAEAFGMVIIESLACGTPVVASKIGGMPAVIADTGGGCLAEPGDPESLAAGMSDLLRDAERRRTLGATGCTAVAERYGWDSVIDEYDALIVRLVARKSALAGR